MSRVSASTDAPKEFRQYLSAAPDCDVTVERVLGGKVEYVRVRRQGDALTVFKRRLEPPPVRLSSNQLATVVHLDGTNNWSITSAAGGVNVVIYDTMVRERNVATIQSEAWQVLNMGPAIPPRAIPIGSTRIDYQDTFADALRSNSISLALGDSGAVTTVTNRMVSGTNIVEHRFAYEYAESTARIPWLPSKSALTITPAGWPEVRNAGSWRLIDATILDSRSDRVIANPQDCFAEGTVVTYFHTRNGDTYKLVDGKAVRAESLGRPQRDMLSRIVFIGGTLGVAALSVVLFIIGRKRNKPH
jgi:hypothetical protein